MKPNPWHSETLTTAAAAEKVLKGNVIENTSRNLFPGGQTVIYTAHLSSSSSLSRIDSPSPSLNFDHGRPCRIGLQGLFVYTSCVTTDIALTTNSAYYAFMGCNRSKQNNVW